jgi:tetratricopeptide (TPR) repeat protein
VEAHEETTLGHEEVYLVLSGRATFTLGDETLDAPAGTVVFIRNPAVVRHARAEEDGTQVLAVGGPREAAFEPSPWEDFFAATRHRAAGDYEAYLTELEEALERRPDHPATLYNVGRAKLLLDRPDEAMADIRRALELNPALRDYAACDEDLASLRERPDWPS